jgi:hypothetical protein
MSAFGVQHVWWPSERHDVLGEIGDGQGHAALLLRRLAVGWYQAGEGAGFIGAIVGAIIIK